MNQIRIRFLLSAAIAITFMAVPMPTFAANFRVTSKIYEGANLDASAEHWILFDERLVYDLPQIASRFVTVYDLPKDQVTLLDRHTQVKTRLKTDDLVKAIVQIRDAAKTPQQKEKLGLTAKVVPSNRVTGLSIRFGNSEHHTTTQAPNDLAVAVDYGRFVDLALRLNIFRLGVPPPFARMTLNDHITASGQLPLKTSLTLQLLDVRKEYRSTHELSELNDSDRKEIAQVRGMLALYRDVPLKKFPKR
jgi:hypothetical protein